MEIINVLVTGSEGYIGSVLTEELTKRGYSVTGIDTMFFKDGFKKGKKKHILKKKDIRHITLQDLQNIDAIIHLAALSNDAMGELKNELTQKINYEETIRLAKLAKKAGVKRFVFSSSCSAYGIAETDIVNEQSTPNPQTAYAKSKILSEKELKKLATKKFVVVLLRNSTVYGFSPRFRDDLVINNFVAHALTLGEIRVKSDGTPWRPLIDVRDLCSVFCEFLSIPSIKINGEIINIGMNGNNFQIKDLLHAVHKESPACKIIFTGEHGSDTRSYRVNFDKFRSLLPIYTIHWDIEKSIRDLFFQLKKYHYTSEDLKNGRYSRITVLKRLLDEQQLDKTLFWRKK